MSRKRRDQKEESVQFESEDELIDSLIVDLNSSFEESTMLLENDTRAQVTAWIPSGSPVIDAVLGGGWPAGRIVEIYGPESNGKTTVALHAIAETQKLGGITVFLDTEHALDKRRAKAVGVNLKKLIYAQPETMEDLFSYVEELVEKIKQKAPDRLVTVVWDSVAATPTKAEIEGEYGEQLVGIHGRIMSQAFRKITNLISKHKVLFICINQVRDKIGTMYGDKTATPGGRALKFYSTIRLEVKKTGNVKEDDKIVGIECKATVKKNKVAPPFGEAQFNIMFKDEDGGIDAYGSTIDYAQKLGIFGDKKGWFVYKDKNYRRNDLIQYFKENPEEWKTIVDTVIGNIG